MFFEFIQMATTSLHAGWSIEPDVHIRDLEINVVFLYSFMIKSIEVIYS